MRIRSPQGRGEARVSEDLRRLAWLISDPSQVEEIPLEDIPSVLGVLESVRVRLEKRFMATSPIQADSEPSKAEDRLLDVKDVAERIGVKPKWIYDHFNTLPFGKRLADRTLRFSERGLVRWLEGRPS